MRKVVNNVHIEGQLYNADLKIKTTGPNSKNPGTEYINGSISVAVDEDRTNILNVHYTYVQEYTNAGKLNSTFINLKSIIDGSIKPYMAEDGGENAPYVIVDTAIALNDFYSNQSGKEELVSVKRNEGGFIHFVKKNELNSDIDRRNEFKVDMVITNLRRIEADEEKNTSERAVIKGATFGGFGTKRTLLPMEFTIFDADGINYIESLEPSNKTPVFIQLIGEQISKTIVNTVVKQGAFGNRKIVEESKTSYKDFVVLTCENDPYPWDDEGSITAAEFGKMIADRNLYLATVKKNRDDYLASKGTQQKTTTAAVEVETKDDDDEDYDF